MTKPLLPCPFCGSNVYLDVDEYGAEVQCDICGATGPYATDKPETAVEGWNTRAHTLHAEEEPILKDALPGHRYPGKPVLPPQSPEPAEEEPARGCGNDFFGPEPWGIHFKCTPRGPYCPTCQSQEADTEEKLSGAELQRMYGLLVQNNFFGCGNPISHPYEDAEPTCCGELETIPRCDDCLEADTDFEEASDYVVEKNKHLYRALADDDGGQDGNS